MKITDEMFAAARKAYLDGGGDLRAALEAALGTAIKQPVHIQDPRVLAESLIVLGPSSDGAVERDLCHALEQQATCIEDLAVALRECLQSSITDAGGKEWPVILRNERERARATLEKWGLK